MYFLAVTALIWGFSFALAKMALAGFHPSQLAFYRLGLGFLTAAFIYRREIRRFQFIPALLIGLFEFALTYLLYIHSLAYLPSGVVGTLTLLTPLSHYLLGIPFGVVSPSLSGGIAILLSIAGGLLAIPPQVFHQTLEAHFLSIGVGLILLSNLSFSIGNIWVARHRERLIGNSIWGQGIGALLICAYMLFTGDSFHLPQALTLKNLSLLLWLGTVPTGIGFMFWNRGIGLAGVLPAAIFSNVKGPLSLLFGYFLLSESLSWKGIAGAFLLFLGAIVLSMRTGR